MLTTAEAITRSLLIGLNKGSQTVELDPAARRRAWHFLKVIGQTAHTHSPDAWKLVDGSVTITGGAGNGYGSMPSNFGSGLDHQGDVYVTATKKPLSYVEPYQLDAMRTEHPATQDYPQVYTFKGKTALGLTKILVWPIPASNVALTVTSYLRQMPEFFDAPVPPAMAEGAAGNLTGSYRYRVTFVHADGETEGGGVAIDALTVAAKKIELTRIPLFEGRGCTARKLYRNANGGYVYKLVDTIADNLTTAYSDNVADGALGATCPTPAEAVTGLEQFPADFHEQLFLEYVIGRLKGSVGDAGQEVQAVKAAWERVQTMWARGRHGQNQAQSLPAYGRTRGVGVPRTWRERIAGR